MAGRPERHVDQAPTAYKAVWPKCEKTDSHSAILKREFVVSRFAFYRGKSKSASLAVGAWPKRNLP